MLRETSAARGSRRSTCSAASATPSATQAATATNRTRTSEIMPTPWRTGPRWSSASCLRRTVLSRKRYLDQGSLLRRACQMELRPVRFRHRFRQRQSEARSSARSSSELPERFKSDFDLFFTHAHPRVSDAQNDLLAFATRGDDHLPPRAGKLDRIGKQVKQDLAHGTRVGNHRRKRVRQGSTDDDALPDRLRLHQHGALLHELVQCEAGEGERQLPSLDFRQIKKIVDQ